MVGVFRMDGEDKNAPLGQILAIALVTSHL
jgi:hypothetical protein